MRHTTRWRPTFCACVLEYEWHDEDLSKKRCFASQPCEAHARLGLDHQVLYDRIVLECRQRGKVLDAK
jgi:hypothetical protein